MPFRQPFAKAVNGAGLPHVSFHSLRRLHATTGLRAGVDLLTMSKRLGHSSVSVTGNIYAHFIEELDHEAAEKRPACYCHELAATDLCLQMWRAFVLQLPSTCCVRASYGRSQACTLRT